MWSRADPNEHVDSSSIDGLDVYTEKSGFIHLSAPTRTADDEAPVGAFVDPKTILAGLLNSTLSMGARDKRVTRNCLAARWGVSPRYRGTPRGVERVRASIL